MQAVINSDLIEFLAKLGKVQLTQQQINQYQHDLEEIINYVSMVGQMNTKNIKAKFHTTNKTNTFQQATHPQETLNQDKVLQNASKTKKHMFIVPRIIHK